MENEQKEISRKNKIREVSLNLKIVIHEQTYMLFKFNVPSARAYLLKRIKNSYWTI